MGFLCIFLCISLFCVGCGDTSHEPLVNGASLEGAWYKGDLHCHSTYSDGDSSVKDVIASAESIGLDFFVITDHDGNMVGSPTHWYDPDYRSEKLVLLYGVEWTTGLGHANVWASHPFDYEDLWNANRARDAQAAIEVAHRQGALFSINHPSPYQCCPWEYEDYEGIDSIEVWNAMYRLPSFNAWSTEIFWDEHLLTGLRVTGLGGSDTHRLKGVESIFLHHGEPTTWVFAQTLSAEALLAGIEAGHVSVSCEPAGPRIDFMADTDDDGVFETMMGDNLIVEKELNVTLRIRAVSQDNPDSLEAVLDLTSLNLGDLERKSGDDLENFVSDLLKEGEYLVVLIKNGRMHGAWKITGDTAQIEFTEKVAPGEQVFYRTELWGNPEENVIKRLLAGFVMALSNPIYFGYSE